MSTANDKGPEDSLVLSTDQGSCTSDDKGMSETDDDQCEASKEHTKDPTPPPSSKGGATGTDHTSDHTKKKKKGKKKVYQFPSSLEGFGYHFIGKTTSCI